MKSCLFLYRCLIVDYIYNSSKNKDYSFLKEKQCDLFHYIRKNLGNTISIVSLNYDDILRETVSKQYFNGFAHESSSATFNSTEFYKRNKTLSYLHGNIRFGHKLDAFMLSSIPTIDQRICDLMKHEHKLHYLPYSDRKGITFNTFITTGLSKDIALNIEPYNHYYNKFARDIFKSNLLIIIGYSFSDEHVNRLLSSFLCLNNENKILIVDYWKVDKRILSFVDNIFYKIAKAFDLREDPKLDFRNDKFEMIFPRVLFYKNGYKLFLDTYKSVIEYIQKA